MKKSFKHAAIALAALCACGSLVHAGDLDTKVVPADAKMIAHIDIAGARGTDVYKLILESMQKQPDYEKNRAEITKVLGEDFEAKLDNVEIVAREYSPTGVVAVIAHSLDEAKIKEAIKAEGKSKTVETYNGVEIYQSVNEQEGQQPTFFCMPSAGKAVFAGDVTQIKNEIDVLGGKLPSIAPTSPLIHKPAAGMYLWAIADQMDQTLPPMGPQPADANPDDSKIDKVVLTAGEQNKAMVMHGVVDFRTVNGATRTATSVNGLKMMISMAQNQPNQPPQPPQAQAGLAIINAFTVMNKDKQVNVDFNMSNEQLKSVTEQLKQVPGGPGGPGGDMPPPPPPPAGGGAPGGPL